MADAAYPPKARLKTSCRRPAASRVERVPRDAFGPSHQGGDVAAAIEDMQNKHVLALDAVEDDVGIYREAPQTRAQVAALPANVRMGGEQVKTAADGIHYAVGAFDAAASRCRARCRPARRKPAAPGDAPSAARGVLRLQAAAPALHVFSKRAHGLGGDDGSLASGKSGLGLIDARQNFGAAALALFPQRHRLCRGVLGARNPSGVDGLADKGFLVGGRANFHKSS